MNKKRIRKFILYAALFIAIMALTFWNVFRGQDFNGMLKAVGEMSGWYVVAAIFLAVSFVAGEGSRYGICFGALEKESPFFAACRIHLQDSSFPGLRLLPVADSPCSSII